MDGTAAAGSSIGPPRLSLGKSGCRDGIGISRFVDHLRLFCDVAHFGEKWKSCNMRPLWFVLAIAILSAQGARAYSRACASCGPEFETRVKSVTEEFTVDIHAQKKMSCETCHGSSPNGMPTARSYYIPRARIPELCGSCHADAARIKQFNPSLRTDQLAQYRTSVHGIKFAHGDTRVAVCTDCHFTHIIRPSSDPESSVHPMNVAVTCKRCHS